MKQRASKARWSLTASAVDATHYYPITCDTVEIDKSLCNKIGYRAPFRTAGPRLFVIALPPHVDTVVATGQADPRKIQGQPDYLGEQELAEYKRRGDDGGNGAVQGKTEVFDICSWLKNGDGLAPVLFNLALDWLIILKWKLVVPDLTKVSR